MLVNRSFAMGCVATAVLVLLMGAPGGASAQLLNGSFELPSAAGGDVPGTANWSTFNQAFTTATTAHFGSQCLKTFGPFVMAGGTGGVQALPASPGQTWVGEVWALNWTADPIDNVDFGVYKIEFLNASMQLAAGGLAGVDIFESNAISAATPPDVWTMLGVGTAPAPAGTAYARAVIVKVDMDGAQGGSIFWDDASMYQQGVGVDGAPGPAAFELLPNAPNPFNPSTRIGFVLDRPDDVDITVYDVAGRRVVTLLHARVAAGSHAVRWDGATESGEPASSGVYRAVLRTTAGLTSRNMTLMK
jgi:hypothetical protein